MLIIEIALGIVLAVVILANLEAIIAIVMVVISVALTAAVVLGVVLYSIENPKFGAGLGVILAYVVGTFLWFWFNDWLDRKGIDIDVNFMSFKPVRIVRK